MKNCVVCFNCHGDGFLPQLNNSEEFKKTFKVNRIKIHEYIAEGYQHYGKTDLIQAHKDLLNNCNLLIVQYIKNNRGFINHNKIISMCNEDCKIIIIPHYTFSGYNPHYYPSNDTLLDSKDYDNVKNYIYNMFSEECDVKKHINDEIKHINDLDEFSNIKMHNFVKNNYQKHLLFYSRGKPTMYFYHEMAVKILTLLNINSNITMTNLNIDHHTYIPILPNVQKYLGLEFDTSPSIIGVQCNVVEYFVACKKSSTDYLTLSRLKKGKAQENILKDVINSNNYK